MQLRYGLPAELVVARGIPFRTVCEHHLLPFLGLPLGARAADHAAVASYDLQAKPGPRTRDFTNARHDEKRHADQVNIDSWRSG